MKFIVIDKSAAKSLISMRNLQSTEYESGRNLAAILAKGVTEDTLIGSVGVVKVKDGTSFVGDDPNFDSQLIIDVDYFEGFSDCSPADALCVFQKTCRVAVKYWDKIPFTGREWYKADKDLVILIPKKIVSAMDQKC